MTGTGTHSWTSEGRSSRPDPGPRAFCQATATQLCPHLSAPGLFQRPEAGARLAVNKALRATSDARSSPAAPSPMLPDLLSPPAVSTRCEVGQAWPPGSARASPADP